MIRVMTDMLAEYPPDWLTCHCGRAFTTPEGRVLHEAAHRGVCIECPGRRFTQAELRAHRRTHAPAKWIVCAPCFVHCRDEDEWRQHATQHEGKPLKVVPRPGIHESDDEMTEFAQPGVYAPADWIQHETEVERRAELPTETLLLYLRDCEVQLESTKKEDARTAAEFTARIAKLDAELAEIEAAIVRTVLE